MDNGDEEGQPGPLTRTLSKLETARKAKELRHTLRTEKPVPMSMTMAKMPEEMEQRDVKKDHYFYQDDGGFQASHEDNAPGDVVYYLGIIDCLTHVSLRILLLALSSPTLGVQILMGVDSTAQ